MLQLRSTEVVQSVVVVMGMFTASGLLCSHNLEAVPCSLAVIAASFSLHPVILCALLRLHFFSLAKDANHWVLSCVFFWL